MSVQGLITIPSSYGPKDTMGRLESAVKAKGMMAKALDAVAKAATG